MPDRDDLTPLFSAPSDRRIDTDAVVRRARRRRLPRQLAVGGVAAVAVVGLVIGGGSLLRGVATSTASGMADSASRPEAAPGAGGAPDGAAGGGTDAATDGGPGQGPSGGDAIGIAPLEKLNPCGGSLADLAPDPSGLVLTTDFPSVIEAGTASVTGWVTLTNTGTGRVTGTTSAVPTITLSRDGRTVWHSNGPVIAMAAVVDLAPGESMRLGATLTPVVCDGTDEGRESFRDDLPAAAPGGYDVSAVIQVTPQTGGSPIVVVGSRPQPVTIR
ncbi:hypothetical protein QT381_14290 [Galbitalea sp. SE-J8]|uniref:hypothetical protein n=1 Tax=Galbitalea sp. SE-J8 TaxID=3054952 RepID=UPI00259C7F12|nr:hypothetical protein [Galbitalea sp. SE-J8]MDM4764176.1 hypothetical protein [Galbitalea sp. SE-J8]